MPGGRTALLLGLGLAVGGGVLLFLGPGGEVPAPPELRSAAGQEEPRPDPGPAPLLQADPAEEPGSGPQRGAPGADPARHGAIAGELQIEGQDALPSISKFWIYLQEARNPAIGSAQTFTREFQYGDQGGRFLLPEVPFGAWRVSVLVPEMIGSEVIRVLTPEEPLARVVLTVKKGRTLPIFVHDPDRRPLEGVDILLHPRGDPPGRRTLAGKTDGLGTAALENVLTGEYEIHVGPQWQLLAEPSRITVGPVEPRFVRYEIRQGGDLKVTVMAEGGYPILGAQCSLISFQSSKYREFKATSDKLGLAPFGKVPQGQYQLRVQAEGFRVEIKPGVEVVENQENRLDIYLKYYRGE